MSYDETKKLAADFIEYLIEKNYVDFFSAWQNVNAGDTNTPFKIDFLNKIYLLGKTTQKGNPPYSEPHHPETMLKANMNRSDFEANVKKNIIREVFRQHSKGNALFHY